MTKYKSVEKSKQLNDPITGEHVYMVFTVSEYDERYNFICHSKEEADKIFDRERKNIV